MAKLVGKFFCRNRQSSSEGGRRRRSLSSLSKCTQVAPITVPIDSDNERNDTEASELCTQIIHQHYFEERRKDNGRQKEGAFRRIRSAPLDAMKKNQWSRVRKSAAICALKVIIRQSH